MSTEEKQKDSVLCHAPWTDNEYPFWLCQYGKTLKGKPCHQIRVQSDVSCIQYVISGSGVIISDNYAFNVNKGDTFILKEEKNQNYYSNPDNNFERIWINFKGVLGKELLKIYNLQDTVILRNTNSLPLLLEIQEACQSIEDPKEYKDVTSRLFLKLIQFLSDRKPVVDDIDNQTDYIRLYLDCHITENIKLSEVAEFAHTTPEHIIRCFKKKYNITPHQYIIRSKITIAISMLEVTDKTIEEISQELNFSNHHHFSTLFQKNVGVRPSVYRKRIREKKA